MSDPQPAARGKGDEAELAQFGYKQSIKRHTGKFASFAVAFAFARRGRDGLAMPDQHSIDAVLDEEAGTLRP